MDFLKQHSEDVTENAATFFVCLVFLFCLLIMAINAEIILLFGSPHAG